MCFDEANRTRKSVAKFGSGGGRGRRRADEGGGAGDGEEGSGHWGEGGAVKVAWSGLGRRSECGRKEKGFGGVDMGG